MLRFILTGYIEKALSLAEYDKLEDGTYAGRIPPCKGVIAFAETLRECENELRSTLEGWLLVGLRLGHPECKPSCKASLKLALLCKNTIFALRISRSASHHVKRV